VEAARAARVRRRGLGFGAAIMTALAVLVAVTVVAGTVFLISPGGGSSVAATFLRSQPGSIAWDGKAPLHVLLVTRAESSGVADSLNLASYDPGKHTVALLSIPTNLWGTIPGFGQSTVSSALQDGDTSLMLETVESVTHVVVPYYVVMSHASLASWIDAFGGVTVRADEPVGLAPSGRPLIAAGRHHLSGTAAVTFMIASGAYDGQDGASRLARQQTVLLALLHRVLQPANLLRLPVVLSAQAANIETNFPFSQMPALARDLSSVRAGSVSRQYLGLGNGTVTMFRSGSTPVLVPDDLRITGLTRTLFPPTASAARQEVAVLNGSGVSGQAAQLASWLQRARVSVGQVASAPSFGYRRTQVWLSRQAPARARQVAVAVSTLLQIPIVYGSVRGSRSPVAVVIGQDFRNPAE
jgi:LCP family protein required for cell wall assembly